jgi:large subunit ribosomal protein L9
MKVILKQDVKALGKKDQMVDVSDGYARNFLLPKGLAMEATADNINVMNQKNVAEQHKKDKALAQAKELAVKLNDLTVVIKTKAGENGKLFGSITTKEIAEKLKEQHHLDIDKKKMNLDEAIKTLGTTAVEAKLHPGVSAKFTVKIVQE